MKKILITIVGLVLVFAGWMLLVNRKDVVVATPTPVVSPTATSLASPESTVSPSPVVSQNIVTYSDAGYTPNTITIKKGETVTWKNESSILMWTASAVHPTHKAYPGTNIANCGTSLGLNQFDSCKGLAPGQSWSFKFENIGTWGYHNHVRASHIGKIIVQ